MTKDLRKRTIYPPEWATDITGGKAGQLNEAIIGWALMLKEAMIHLDATFDEKDWSVLLLLLRNYNLDVETDDWGGQLLGYCLVASADEDPALAQHVQEKLRAKLLSLTAAEAYLLCRQANRCKKLSPRAGWWRTML